MAEVSWPLCVIMVLRLLYLWILCIKRATFCVYPLLNRIVMKLQFYLSIIMLFLALQVHTQDTSWTVDDVPVYKTFDDFEPILHQDNDTTYVVNFWATWCGPCVKELPYFEALHESYMDQPVKVVLVSLDFEKHIIKKLLPFLNKKDIQSDVVLLADGKANNWIDKVGQSWSGAIPITLVYKGDKREFYEKEFHSEQELVNIISPFLN